MLATGFGPGYNGPLQLVAQTDGAAQKQAFSRVLIAAKRTPGVASVTPAVTLTGGSSAHPVTFANVYPTGSPQAASTSRLLTTLRDRVVPQSVADSGVRVLIGGQTAIFSDFAGVLSSKLPLFIAVV